MLRGGGAADISRRTYLATAVLIAGVLLLVMFGNHESKQYTFRELQVRRIFLPWQPSLSAPFDVRYGTGTAHTSSHMRSRSPALSDSDAAHAPSPRCAGALPRARIHRYVRRVCACAASPSRLARLAVCARTLVCLVGLLSESREQEHEKSFSCLLKQRDTERVLHFYRPSRPSRRELSSS